MNTKSPVISAIIWAVASILGKTWKITIASPQGIDPFNDIGQSNIYCFWHAKLLMMSYAFRNTGKTAVVSKSRDGQIAAAVARYWKHEIIYGSSSRGGASALRQCLKVLKSKRCIVITPDGPRGPKEKVKAGIAQIATASGALVIPVFANPNRFWQLNSWDRFIIPKPFARIRITLGDPVKPVHQSDSGESVEQCRSIIEERLHAGI